MPARVATVAFRGIETLAVDVQVHVGGGGWPGIYVVGLPDKAVGESRERVHAALSALGLAIPQKRIVVNLAPADLPKEGSHFDLAIALAILQALGALSVEDLAGRVAMGELALDGRITAVAGVLPTAIAASAAGHRGLVCPEACGPEARWADDLEVIAAPDLLSLLNHLRGVQVLPDPPRAGAGPEPRYPDLRDIKGQETAKRALEVTAAGGHNLLMVGPPGAGKSMMAARLPGLLPALTPAEALEASMIRSVAGELKGGRIDRARPFRCPHHSSSMPALIGGGCEFHLIRRLNIKFDDSLLDVIRRGVLARISCSIVHRAAMRSTVQLAVSGRPAACGS